MRVLRRDEPLGEVLTAIDRRVELQLRPIEWTRRQRYVQARVVDFAARRRVDADVAARRAVLERDARKQVRHLVIVLLRPLLQGMIVTARARDREAHERYRDVLGDLGRVFMQ